ncbi:hypothetical protein Tco_0869616 [Tanacetum coccineum]
MYIATTVGWNDPDAIVGAIVVEFGILRLCPYNGFRPADINLICDDIEDESKINTYYKLETVPLTLVIDPVTKIESQLPKIAMKIDNGMIHLYVNSVMIQMPYGLQKEDKNHVLLSDSLDPTCSYRHEDIVSLPELKSIDLFSRYYIITFNVYRGSKMASILKDDKWWRGHARAFLKHVNLSTEALRQGRVSQTRREASYFVMGIHHLKSFVICVRGIETPEDLLTDDLIRICMLTTEIRANVERMRLKIFSSGGEVMQELF